MRRRSLRHDLLNIFRRTDADNFLVFEWLQRGAGFLPERRRQTNGRSRVLNFHDLRYGFEKERSLLRVDPFLDACPKSKIPDAVIIIKDMDEIAVVAGVAGGSCHRAAQSSRGVACILSPEYLRSRWRSSAFSEVVLVRKDKLGFWQE